jgi:hypothetical protein
MHVLRIGLCGVNESNCPKWLSPRNVLTLDLMMPSEANRKIGHIQDAIPHWGLQMKDTWISNIRRHGRHSGLRRYETHYGWQQR